MSEEKKEEEKTKGATSKQIRNTKRFFILIAAGLIWNTYTRFFKAEDKSQGSENNIVNSQIRYAEPDMTNDTIREFFEARKEYQNYLDEAEVLMRDSMDCDCPNLKGKASQ